MGSQSLLQGIFQTQGLNLGLLHCRQILYCLSHHSLHCRQILYCLSHHRSARECLRSNALRNTGSKKPHLPGKNPVTPTFLPHLPIITRYFPVSKRALCFSHLFIHPSLPPSIPYQFGFMDSCFVLFCFNGQYCTESLWCSNCPRFG